MQLNEKILKFANAFNLQRMQRQSRLKVLQGAYIFRC